MAHNLHIEDGVASIAYAGQTPWHTLGQKVPADLEPRQIAKAARANFRVEVRPAKIELNGKWIETQGGALVRLGENGKPDVILDHLRNRNTWHPVQNEEAFAFFNEAVAEGDMTMETAGVLGKGETVWALARVKESFYVVKKKDEIQSYLLFTNPHQFGRSVNVRFTPTRVVCNNTLSVALSETGNQSVSRSHRNPFNADEIKEKLGLAHYKLNEYKERAQFLASQRYTVEQMKEYFTTVFPANEPKPTKVEGVKTASKRKPKELHRGAQYAMAIVDTQPGADIAPGTFWNLYNAATFYTNHLAGKSDSSRVHSLWYGDSEKTNLLALNTAVEMAKAA